MNCRKNFLKFRSHLAQSWAIALVSVLPFFAVHSGNSQSSRPTNKSTSKTSGSNSSVKPPVSPSPTLDETLDWLAKHLSAIQVSFYENGQRDDLASGSYDIADVVLTANIDPVSLKSCDISFKYSQEFKRTSTLHYGSGKVRAPEEQLMSISVTYSISLGDIKDSHAEETTLAKTSLPHVYFKNGTYPISVVVLNGRGSSIIQRGTGRVKNSDPDSSLYQDHTLPEDSALSSLNLYTQDSEMAGRIANALSHATDLCRDKQAF